MFQYYLVGGIVFAVFYLVYIIYYDEKSKSSMQRC